MLSPQNEFLFNKTKRRTNFSKFILVKKIYMFRAVPLPIIRSITLYIRHWYMSCKFDDSFQALVVLESCLQTCITYRVSQEEWTKLRQSVPYVELYRCNPKHLYPKLNGYGDNGHRKVWASGVSTYCTPSVTPYSSITHARQRETTS